MSLSKFANVELARPTSSRTAISAAETELNRSSRSRELIWLYRMALRASIPGARKILFRLIRKLEAGDMNSATLRDIMQECHGVSIGAHSYGCFDPVRFPAGTMIERYVSIGPQVHIYRRNHPMQRLSLHPYFYNSNCGGQNTQDVPTAPLRIGADAWIGGHAVILPGCEEISRGAVIAAGAVVTKDVPPYAVVGGNPAKIIRYRFDSATIKAAEASQWWRLHPETATQRFDMTSNWQSASSKIAQGPGR